MEGPPDKKPLFHVKTRCKNVNMPVIVNYFYSKTVKYPDYNYDEEGIVSLFLKEGPELPGFKLPYSLSPICWSPGGRHEGYVISALINDRWAIERVLKSSVLTHATISIILLGIEKDYNSENPSQRIGHKFNLDMLGYKVVSGEVVELGEKVVDSKIIEETGGTTETCDDSKEEGCNLYYRPSSKLLTCSVMTAEAPDSISFNEDRIVIKSDGTILTDVILPFYIDLNVPVKYKYDEKSSLFRAVFKIVESVEGAP